MARLGRELACTRCNAIYDVIGDVDDIDPTRYVCGQCMRPVPGQLEIVEGHQVDEHDQYEPSDAKIPF